MQFKIDLPLSPTRNNNLPGACIRRSSSGIDKFIGEMLSGELLSTNHPISWPLYHDLARALKICLNRFSLSRGGVYVV